MNKYIYYIQNNKQKIISKSLVFCSLCGIIVTLFYILQPKTGNNFRTWDEITDSKIVKVGILYNYTDYYISHGKVYGFHYELIKKFAENYSLEVIYKLYDSYGEYCYALLHNEIDLLAMDISKNMSTEILFDFSIPHSFSKLILVQHKKNKYFKKNGSSLSTQKSNYLIVVPAYTPYYAWAIELKKKYRNRFNTSISYLTSEELLDELDNAVIDFTIANQKNVEANSIFYSNLDYAQVLTGEMPLYWIVNKGNDSLSLFINDWLNAYKQKKEYVMLLKKYYDPTSSTRLQLKQKSRITPFGDISPYDDIIMKYANQYGLDWLFVSSLIYQESKFYAHMSGIGGSYGLMQFMPATASYWGVNIGDSPEQQIKAGCKYLKFLVKKYRDLGVSDSIQLMKFVLAAYNAGSCRVDDAIKIAKRRDYNTSQWDHHVGSAFQLLSDRKSIKNSKLKCGRYANTKHTLRYINEVMHRYEHYKNINKQSTTSNSVK